MKRLLRKEIPFLLILLMTVTAITGFELRYLRTGQLIDSMCSKAVDYEEFRAFRINERAVVEAEARTKHFIKQYPQLSGALFIDPIGYLCYSMMAYDYDLTRYGVVDEQTFRRGIAKVASTRGYQELYGYYKAILQDIRFFPVPELEGADITYSNSWKAPRTYGGERFHEGTDLMASNNLRGYFPVLSITDGVIEKKGWLEQGGYRIGIRSEAGGYFYYAHLDTYAPDLNIGDAVIAGQLLGFMGDSGYGSEGTVGKFDVHLHLGIYVNVKNEEMSVNPYQLLQILEKNRIKYD